MNILQGYIVKTMAFYTLIVMFIWLSVYGFLNFIGEIKQIGSANYTAFDAFFYVLADLPAVLYSHYPVIILLGTLLALNNLSATSQLVVIRAAGVSIMSVAKIVVNTALWFCVVVVLIGEFIAPTTTEYAQYSRNNALGYNQTEHNNGFWLKDGNTIIRFEKNLGGHLFENITLIKLNNDKQLDSILYADKASFDGVNLNFKKAQHYKLDRAKNSIAIHPQNYEQYNIQVSFDKKLIADSTKEPNELSTWNLYQQIVFLSDNELVTDVFKIELYKRLIKPLTLIAMILFSMLFVFGSLRDSSLGRNIFLGLVLSLFFELSFRIGGALSLKFAHSYFLSASIPTLVALIVAFILLKRRSLRCQ